jgi:hypothetical protein
MAQNIWLFFGQKAYVGEAIIYPLLVENIDRQAPNGQLGPKNVWFVLKC